MSKDKFKRAIKAALSDEYLEFKDIVEEEIDERVKEKLVDIREGLFAEVFKIQEVEINLLRSKNEPELKLIKKIFEPDFVVYDIRNKVGNLISVKLYSNSKRGYVHDDGLPLPGVAWTLYTPSKFRWYFEYNCPMIDGHKLMKPHVKKINAMLKNFNEHDSSYLKKLKALIMDCWEDAKIAYDEFRGK